MTAAGGDARLAGRHLPVVIIGGGQAGLSMSWYLKDRGVEHIVLERDTAGHEWSDGRWDSFCLVTPNWQCQLPGWPYTGDDPDGFMVREQIVDYLARYVASFDPPVAQGVTVTAVTGAQEGFALETTAGPVTAGQVVVAVGGYHTPIVPAFAPMLPATVTQLHSSQYKSPEQLPAGEVLVVGSGQSGAQLAEDLQLAGRTVHLATGGAPRCARFYRGRDVISWLSEMGYYDMPVSEHSLGDRVRAQANHYVTGRGGGHDLDLRGFALQGMSLYGRLTDFSGGRLQFADDLAANLDAADQVFNGINATIDKHIAEQHIDAPPGSVYEPLWEPGPGHPRELDPARLAAVIWAIGYRADYRWIDLPAFSGRGYPTHERGVTTVPGLFFLGLPWQWTWGSGRFSGVARDAEHLAELLAPVAPRADSQLSAVGN